MIELSTRAVTIGRVLFAAVRIFFAPKREAWLVSLINVKIISRIILVVFRAPTVCFGSELPARFWSLFMKPLPQIRSYGPRHRRHLGRCRTSLAAWLGMGMLLPATLMADRATPRHFDLPAGDALVSLKRFAAQANEQILYSPDDLCAVQTQAVQGEFLPLAALEYMFQGSPLKARQDIKTQAISIISTAYAHAPPETVAAQQNKNLNTPNTLPMSSVNIKPKSLIAATVAFFSSTLFAQTVAPDSTQPAKQEDIIMLSPFVVNSSKDVGYAARETLSGGRTSAELKDISAQVDVMTDEFLSDLAITSIEDSLKYSLSVESGSEYFDAVGGDSTQGPNPFNPSAGNRARGLARASISIGFFETSIPVDNYSTERLTFVGGPNAILFGNGLSGGSIDTAYKRAKTNKDRYSISAQIDTEDGYRTTVDANKVLIKNVLALRFAGLKQDVPAGRAPSYDRSERGLATITFQPSNKLNIRAYREAGSINKTPVRSTLVQDKVTPYFNKFLTPEQKAQYLATYDPSVLVGFNNSTLNSLASTANTTALSAALLAQGLVPALPSTNADIFGRLTSQQGVLILGGVETSPIPIQSWNNTATLLTSPGILVGDTGSDWSFTDGSVYPTTINLTGNSFQNRIRFHNYGAVVEFNPVKNLFLEYGANREFVHYQWRDLFEGTNAELNIDLNRYLPAQWAVGATAPPRALNPNYGRYYIQSSAPKGGRVQQNRSDDRATIAYSLDFTKEKDWKKWLGTHKLLGLWTKQTNSRMESLRTGGQITAATVISDNDFTISTVAGTGVTTPLPPSLSASSRALAVRQYLGSPTAGVGGAPYVDLKGFDIWNLGTVGTDVSGRPVVATSLDLPNGAYAGPIGNGHKTSTGKMGTINSSFFNNRVILNYGYRADKNNFTGWIPATLQPRYDVATGGFYFPTPGTPLPAAYTNAPYMGWEKFRKLGLANVLDPNKSTDESPKSVLKGIVVHPLSWFSVFYNESTAAYASDFTGYHTDGTALAIDDGSGKDYGFTVSAPNNKFSARVNWFTSTRFGGSSSFDNGRTIKETLYFVEKTFLLNNPTYDINSNPYAYYMKGVQNNAVPLTVTSSNILTASAPGLPGSETTIQSDRKAEGVEVSLTATPFKGLSLRLSGAKNNTGEFNVGPSWFRYLNARWTDWESVGANPTAGVAGAITLNQYMQTVVLPQLTTIIKSEGNRNPQERQYRVNFTAKYQVQGGWAKGISFGGNYSWRSENTLSFLTRPALADEVYRTFNGIGAAAVNVLDFTKPITGPALTTIDAFVGYRRKVFGRYEWLVQLNIRNVFDNDDLIAQRAYGRLVNGVQENYYTHYNVPDPRRFMLTNTISF